ncbi:ATP-binding protein [Ruminococcaceae bacterium OttesenSCG-928-I18]|nr:ATP-binding protein [Ruminococcaceae bacterium OttesenSCG-928-I18]
MTEQEQTNKSQNCQELSDYERRMVDIYNSRGAENPQCPECKDKGYIAITATMVRPCKCKAKRDAERAVKNSGLTDDLRLKTFKSFRTREEWQHALKRSAIAFCEDEGHWFYTGGQVGSGKTHICTAIINELMAQGRIARYMVWPDEVDAIKGNAEDFTTALQKLMEVPVLYIDDFLKTAKERRIDRQGKITWDKKPPTTGELNAAFKLVNYRYNRPEKTTIFSSEFTIEDIMDYDGGLGSRIYQRCKKYRINIGDDDAKNMRLAE